jgi:RNA polymerase sigma factor (TIGR02999 family)
MAEDSDGGEVTRHLQRWREGDPEAFENLVPVVYQQLHNIAIGLMRRERTGHTLQATALLNELYVRLVNQQKITWSDRQQFFTFTAHLMRNILVDHARARGAQRRGGPERVQIPLTDELPWLSTNEESILDLNRALDRLEKMDARKARLVELRFFLSCTSEEAAEILEVSTSTVERDLKFVKSWLYRELAHHRTKAAE